MSRLSIVLVAYREQGFLRHCLTSVLDGAPDDLDDLDVVVVDDAAADNSGAIADEIAATDDRVRVLHLDERHGPGPARLAGLRETRGQHVWFVDPIDLLEPGAAAAVVDRLALDDPDLLVVGHVLQDAFNQRRPGRLGSDPGDGRPAGLWDTVVRRDLVERIGPIATGPEWEAEVVRRLLDAAERKAVLADPVYVRRELPRPVRARSELAGPTGSTPRPAARPAAGRPQPASRRILRRGRRVARTAARLARHPRRLVRRARRLRSAPLRAYYRAQLRRPLDETLVVYAAYWYSAYSCNPRAIYEKARELAPWLHGVWVVDADRVDAMPPGVDFVVAGTRDYYRVMARATYLVNNVNFPNDIVKRPGQVHVQTHHGTPLKTMGMDLAGSKFTGRKMNFPRLLQRVSRWDYSISQNVFTSEQWERVYPSGTFVSLETGYPRNDYLVNATEADVARAREALGIAADQTVLLYLPTHREYHPGYVPQLDPAALVEALGERHVLLVRAHYFYRDAQTGAGGAPQVIDVADHARIEDLYLAADVLITDYSSAMFDYVVLDRPIVIYAPDWEEYRTLRGTTFDLMAQPPGPVALTQQELTEILAGGRAWDHDSTALRASFRDRFASLEDGKASDRVVRTLWPAPPVGHGGPA